ncbi:MAG: hypothetical protein CFH01_00150 [Alphaproteobacteria bacterium MarineAlpha2_Bin1]|nr:MAG: hypothetical protein CFH01_00150 [Alphaproteobacteria bacterium MarineAlpha2_Bin1]
MEKTTVKKLSQEPTKQIIKKIFLNSNSETRDKQESLAKYFSTKLDVYGVPTGKQRNFLREGYSWSDRNLDFQIHIWDEVWFSGTSIEELSQPLFWLQSIKNDEKLFQFWNIIKNWVVKLDNWVHSDLLSHSYSRCLEFQQKKVYPQLVEWNSSNNSWARRQSVVSLLYYSRLRSNFISSKKILYLAENLIFDEDYFVQRGLGWTLRESYNVYPEITYQFIKKNVKNLSSIVFTTSTEKVKHSCKTKLKNLRKKF